MAIVANQLRVAAALSVVAAGGLACSPEPLAEVPSLPIPDGGLETFVADDGGHLDATPSPASAPFDGDCSIAAARRIHDALSEKARSLEDAGFEATGPLRCEDRAQEEHLVMQLQLDPGKCYAVLAHGEGGIRELDLELGFDMGALLGHMMDAGMGGPSMPAPFPMAMQNMVIARDAESGQTALIGADPNGCFKMPMPIAAPSRLDAIPKAGSGPVGVWVFAR